MKYRHEWKHEINYLDSLTLRTRLSAVMDLDPHAKDGGYFIRSLYFDNNNDKALREKLDGVNNREKYRIRFYNFDTSYIVLEKKTKVNGLSSKESCELSKEEAQKIVDGDISWMPSSDRTLCVELYSKMIFEGLKPMSVVDYDRIPYVYAPGNVRVTIDYNIRTGLKNTDFLNSNLVTIPAGESPMILEVKWDEFLPTIIRDVVGVPGRRSASFSKYAQSRVYG